MLEIIASVCALAAPAKCKDVHVTFEAGSATAAECFFYGQSELAKWAGEHDGWRIARWQCAKAGQVANL